MRTIFVTGASGYMGTRLIKALKKNDQYHIKALVRKGSEHNIPAGCEIVIGNALEALSYKGQVAPAKTFIHLVGVAHPSPKKKDAFRKIDFVSIQQAVKAAQHASIEHFIYLSVAQH